MESTTHPLPDVPAASPIFRLNADVVLEVFKFLQPDIRLILSLRQTCKEICNWTRMRQCWYSALLQVATHIPVPFYDRIRVPTMDATEMEALVVRLLRLDRNWNRPGPAPLSVQTVPSSVNGFSGRFTHLKHVAGGRFLLCGSEEDGAPIFCLDFEDPQTRICPLGRWASVEVPWMSPSLRDLFGRHRRFGDSEITVTALFSVRGTEGDTTHTHSSIGIWRFHPQTWPPNPIMLPSLNFNSRLEYIDINNRLIACGRMGLVRVIDYEPSTGMRFQQGVFYPQLHNGTQIRQLRMLSSQILVLTTRTITLFPHPQLHSINELDNIAACHSAVDALWSWPLDENRTGPFRRFSCPDQDLANIGDPLHFNVHQLFFYLTGQHLFTIFPRAAPVAPVEFARLAAKGTSLPQSLRDATRVLLGPSGKRGVWAHGSPNNSHIKIQLVDFWGEGYGPQMWAKSFQSSSIEQKVVMRENQGFVAGLAAMPQMLTFDEDSGIIVLAIADTLVVYRF